MGKCLAQLNKERKLYKEQQMEIDNNSRTVNDSLILNVIRIVVAIASMYYVSKEPSSSADGKGRKAAKSSGYIRIIYITYRWNS